MKAQYRNPKIKDLLSGRRMPYEEALGYSSLSQSKSHKFLSPNAFSKLQHDKARHRNRKDGKLEHSPSQQSVFERLHNEKTEKLLKIEALQQEAKLRDSASRHNSVEPHKSKSADKHRRKSSRSPDDFYRKQMDLKIDSDRRLALQAREHEMEQIKQLNQNRSRSRHRKKSANPNPELYKNVHERLFHGARDRSR